MSNFSKQEACPTSYELNAFQLGECSPEAGRTIRLHLRTCEFCAAESEFYARFPQPMDPVEETPQPDMPRPLRELAETLLNRNRAVTALESLLRKHEAD